MADINSKPARATPIAGNSAGNGTRDVARPSDAARRAEPSGQQQGGQAVDLVKFVELLFFAYRDFTGDADELLADLGYGRAHHRVIHFVARHPGLRVADLLDILRITKQSLARVLKQLIDEGFVTQKAGRADRRERHLFLTQKGLNFADKLAKLQCARIGNALKTVAPADADVVEAFLFAMISDRDQAAVAALFEKAIENEHEQQRASAGGEIGPGMAKRTTTR